MKYIPYLLLLFCVTACNSISKEEYLTNTCACLQGVAIETEDLKEAVADCLQSHFTAYRKGASYSVTQYLENHPTATTEEAQNNVVETLHQELLKSCSKYKELNDRLESNREEL